MDLNVGREVTKIAMSEVTKLLIAPNKSDKNFRLAVKISRSLDLIEKYFLGHQVKEF